MGTLVELAERGLLPDALIRAGIRRRNRERLQRERADDPEAVRQSKAELIRLLQAEPIAIHQERANEQHYDLPAVFFRTALGPRMKYSCCLWPDGVNDLGRAEELALEQVAERADLRDGQRMLDLGCGWGSFTLWAAVRYPGARILAVSNAAAQAHSIEAALAAQHITNVEVVTADVAQFDPGSQFDRVVSIEMFEHLRNYRELLHRIAGWLSPGGKLFVHVFAHRTCAYFFEAQDQNDWMGRYFFTGGLMPSDDLLPSFQDDLALEGHWRLDGQHYQRTLEAWLTHLDAAQAEALPVLERVYGRKDAPRWLQRWRMFLMACSELFGYAGGQEWGVSHYLFSPRRETAAPTTA